MLQLRSHAHAAQPSESTRIAVTLEALWPRPEAGALATVTAKPSSMSAIRARRASFALAFSALRAPMTEKILANSSSVMARSLFFNVHDPVMPMMWGAIRLGPPA